MRIKASDEEVTGYAGLVSFGAYLKQLGVDDQFQRLFGDMKTGLQVVYPMDAQLRLLTDAYAVGEHRPFGLEALAADPLFVHLAGGTVPCLDTVYRDLARFDGPSIATLETMMAHHGLALLTGWRRKRQAVMHLDFDTTVLPVFGALQGAAVGPNPRYHGRPSYHPVLARVAETDALVGALLRGGDTSLGDDDAPTMVRIIDRLRNTIGPDVTLYVRGDAAFDCTEVLRQIHARGAYFLTKAHVTPDLQTALAYTTRWNTLDRDADNKPTLQYAEVSFARQEWQRVDLPTRVIAFRWRDRDQGHQLCLWDEVEYSVQVLITNDMHSPAVEVLQRYRDRAGIEPLIGELKYGHGLGEMPSTSFVANHAAMLLKMLVHNLLRRFVGQHHPGLTSWRVPWLRRALLVVPARLTRRGRSRVLRPAAQSLVRQLE